MSRFTLGVRKVGYRSDDSEIAGLIYITIWQHLRGEDLAKGMEASQQAKKISIKDLEDITLVLRVIVF